MITYISGWDDGTSLEFETEGMHVIVTWNVGKCHHVLAPPNQKILVPHTINPPWHP
jgi:hypothetical protein